jgi:hypothetical protein
MILVKNKITENQWKIAEAIYIIIIVNIITSYNRGGLSWGNKLVVFYYLEVSESGLKKKGGGALMEMSL